MSIESFIEAMPKVELNARLEGSYRKDVLQRIADENEIRDQIKNFNSLLTTWDSPDLSTLHEHFKTYAKWLNFPDDLTRLLYDGCVALVKQNVRYIEMSINPGIHMLPGMTFEEFMEALNDGRDRIERGWGTRIAWVLTVSREEPRLADETIRWASSAAGKKSGIVGFGLSGMDSTQPAGQFERAFSAASKKEVPTVVQAGNTNGIDGILDAMALEPTRLVDGWGLLDDSELIDRLASNHTPVVISMSRAVKHGWVADQASYPLRRLYDENISVVLSAEMPNVYGTTITGEYLAAVKSGSLSIDELIEIGRNGIIASFLPTDAKEELLNEYAATCNELRSVHLSSNDDN